MSLIGEASLRRVSRGIRRMVSWDSNGRETEARRQRDEKLGREKKRKTGQDVLTQRQNSGGDKEGMGGGKKRGGGGGGETMRVG